MKELTYLIYTIFWGATIFGGTGYAVFVLGHSGWWFAVAIMIGCMAYSPMKWIHGKGQQ